MRPLHPEHSRRIHPEHSRRTRPVHTFEIHTDLPVWMLHAIHRLLVELAALTGCAVDFALVTESYHDQAAGTRT